MDDRAGEAGQVSGPAVRLSAGDPERDVLITGRVVLVVGDEPIEIELVVPDGLVAVEETLPVLQGLTDLFVARGVAKAEAAGRTISCRAGCGACCRQLVPISSAEGRALARLVEAMPEPRRSHVRGRFEAALAALDAGGLVARIDQARDTVDDDVGALAMDYFRQGVACPFLEDEACSIHPDRPLICRQYLVTSSAAHCRILSPGTIDMVELPARPSRALLAADSAETKISWLPLVYALRCAEDAPPAPRDRTAPDILRDVIGRL